MSEYIEREKIWPALNAACVPYNRATAKAIEDIPAADVRPVVTCADCKYNKREVTDLWGNDAIQCITGQTHGRNWFCADGKKREES